MTVSLDVPRERPLYFRPDPTTPARIDTASTETEAKPRKQEERKSQQIGSVQRCGITLNNDLALIEHAQSSINNEHVGRVTGGRANKM